jgi:hypothetical protein
MCESLVGLNLNLLESYLVHAFFKEGKDSLSKDFDVVAPTHF